APASATGTGFVTVNPGGALQIGDGTTSGAGTVSGAITLNTNGVQSGSVILDRPDNITFSTPVSGTGDVSLISGATVTLTGTLTHNGTTTITNGTLQGSANNTLTGNSTVVLANSANAVLHVSGNTQTVGALAGGGTSGGIVNFDSNGSNPSSRLVLDSPTGITSTFSGTLNLNGGGITVNGAAAFVQNITGPVNVGSPPTAASGATTVTNGTLNFDFTS